MTKPGRTYWFKTTTKPSGRGARLIGWPHTPQGKVLWLAFFAGLVAGEKTVRETYGPIWAVAFFVSYILLIVFPVTAWKTDYGTTGTSRDE